MAASFSYIDYSPLFPNPLVCLMDFWSRFVQYIPRRLPTRQDGVNWLTESWERQYTAFYFDTTELYTIICAAIGLILFRILLSKLIFQNCLRWFSASERNKYKFSESSFKLLFQSTMTILEAYQCRQTFFHPSLDVKNWTPGQRLSPISYWLMIFQAGYYIQLIYSSIYLNERRKDIVVEFIHHLIAMSLIITNIGFRYGDISVLILLVHDIVDPSLEFGKLCKYLESRNDSIGTFFHFLSGIFFMIFVFQWTLFRIYWFPTKLLHTLVCVYHVTVHEGYPFHSVIALCLIILYCFHIYWYILIIRAAIIAIKGEELRDIREHKK